MNIKQTTIDKGVSVVTAAGSAALSILAAQHVISVDLAAELVTGLGAVVAAWHGGTALATANAVITQAQADIVPVAAPGAPAAAGPTELSAL